MRSVIKPGAKNAHLALVARHLASQLENGLDLTVSQAHDLYFEGVLIQSLYSKY